MKAILISALAIVAAASAYAQTYPEKPVRLVVPFAAGGNVDITARQIAPGLSELLGQNFIVDNRVGARRRDRASRDWRLSLRHARPSSF